MDRSERLKEYQMRRQGKTILAGKQKIRQDGYSNMLNKAGTSQDNSEAYSYMAEEFADDLELTKLYEGNGLFTKIIDRPAEESVKHGYEIDFDDDAISEFVEDKLDELEWEDQFATAEKWARLYGGAIIVMMVDDGRGLEEPLDWSHVKSIDELRVFERSIVQPDYTSLYTFDFEESIGRKRPMGQPKFYTVTSLHGYFTVHYSRCLVFRNGRLPEHTTNALYRFWGIPEYVKIKRALRETITSHSDGVKLLERSVQAIYKMKDLSNTLGTDEGEDTVLKRLQVLDMARGILNSIAIDSEGEDYDFKTLPLSGVKDIIDSTCNMLSAVTDIPQTILFGRSPAGENSTGESDLENYYNMVEKIQKMNMKANGRILIDLILAEGEQSGQIEKTPKYKIKFAPLWSMSETEQAATEQTKATTAHIKAQTAQVYVDMQSLDPSEVRKGLAKSDDYNIQDIIDDDVPLELDPDMFDIKAPPEQEETSEDSDDVEAAAVIVVKEGKILVGKRRGSGLLCGPGGHIEGDETPEEAAKREAFEEFNIVAHNLIPIGVNKAATGLYSNAMIYLCTDFTGMVAPDRKEMISAAWHSMRELLFEKLYPPFKSSLEMLANTIKISLTSSSPTDTMMVGKKDGGEGSGRYPKGSGERLSSKERQRYEKALLGTKTGGGVTITGLSDHTDQRLAERRIGTGKILSALATKPTPGNTDTTKCYEGDGIRIVVDNNGNIVTIMWRKQNKGKRGS